MSAGAGRNCWDHSTTGWPPTWELRPEKPWAELPVRWVGRGPQLVTGRMLRAEVGAEPPQVLGVEWGADALRV